MSAFGGDIYVLQHPVALLSYKRDAWLQGKFVSNDAHNFPVDVGKLFINSERSLKITLKLSQKGLTTGGNLKNVFDRSIGVTRERIDFVRICDIRQDHKYANLLICIVKSRDPQHAYKIFAYKLERVKDVIEFQEVFRKLVTYFPRQDPDRADLTNGFNNMNLSESRRRGTSRSGIVHELDGSTMTNAIHNNSARHHQLYGGHDHRAQNSKTDGAKNKTRLQRNIMVRDVGLQATREKIYFNYNDTLDLAYSKPRVCVFNGVAMADAACMVSASKYPSYDDFEGEATAYVGNDGRHKSHLKRRAVSQDGTFRNRNGLSRFTNSYYIDDGDDRLFNARSRQEVRGLSMSDNSSSEEIEVHLTRPANRSRTNHNDFHSNYYTHNTIRSNHSSRSNDIYGQRGRFQHY